MNDLLRFFSLPLNDSELDLAGHLKKNGYGLLPATQADCWLLDSILFLSKSRTTIGIVIESEGKFVGYKLGKICEKCDTSENKISMTESGVVIEHCLAVKTAKLIWKMWMPVLRSLHGHNVAPQTIHVTTSNHGEHERVECEMTSAFNPMLTSYEHQQECIKAQFRKFTNPILMSNADGVILCRPARKGWRAERLLTVECLNKYRQAERIFNVLFDKIRIESERNIDNKVELLSVAAHALHAAARACGLNISGDDFSIFDADEQEILKQYDQKLRENLKKVSDINDDNYEDSSSEMKKMLPATTKKSKQRELQKQREEREKRKNVSNLFSNLFMV